MTTRYLSHLIGQTWKAYLQSSTRLAYTIIGNSQKGMFNKVLDNGFWDEQTCKIEIVNLCKKRQQSLLGL